MGAKDLTKVCNACNGTGQLQGLEGENPRECASCAGTGRQNVLRLDDSFADAFTTIISKLNSIESKIDALGG